MPLDEKRLKKLNKLQVQADNKQIELKMWFEVNVYMRKKVMLVERRMW